MRNSRPRKPRSAENLALPKAPSGISGLDEVLEGGLPRGRPTLVCGSAGCGKTLLAMEFLVRGALEYGEPGLMVTFEENEQDLIQNTASLGFDLPGLIERKLLLLDYVHVAREEIEETGDYDLQGLFIRLGSAIDAIGARRVVLDTLETLFAGLSNPAILRAELVRLFRWLKERGVTAIVTAERGVTTLTRHGLEEYISDCVIVLDHRVVHQLSTRRLRVLKYRGSLHGTNEYPFLIHDKGISVLPITSLGLQHSVSSERVSSGLAELDAMLGGGGYYRGSTVLLSGTAGSGKSSLAASFCAAAGQRGERSLLFAFEESPAQIIRNMASIGLDLQSLVSRDLVKIHSSRPTLQGLEWHLASTLRLIEEFQPTCVIYDPISCFVADTEEAQAMLIRLVDYLKVRGITGLLTSLTRGGGSLERTEVNISSLVDTWILLRDIELSGERNRGLYILKSRGMNHSNQIRELLMGDQGLQLRASYLGPAGILTGSARLVQEAQEREGNLRRQQFIESQQRLLQRKRQAMESQVAALQADFAAEEVRLEQAIREESRLEQDLAEMAISRHVNYRQGGSRP